MCAGRALMRPRERERALTRVTRGVCASQVRVDERTDGEQIRLERCLAGLLGQFIALFGMAACKLEFSGKAVGLREEHEDVGQRAFVADLAPAFAELSEGGSRALDLLLPHPDDGALKLRLGEEAQVLARPAGARALPRASP